MDKWWGCSSALLSGREDAVPPDCAGVAFVLLAATVPSGIRPEAAATVAMRSRSITSLLVPLSECDFGLLKFKELLEANRSPNDPEPSNGGGDLDKVSRPAVSAVVVFVYVAACTAGAVILYASTRTL